MTAPIGDHGQTADLVGELIRNKVETDKLSHRARRFGLFHSVEEWYGRRAEWTLEAVAKRNSAGRSSLKE